jgi:glutamate dehydrogenase (NADP+)
VIAMSDSSSAVYDPNGIDLAAVRAIKEGHRGRIAEYLKDHPTAKGLGSNDSWQLPCDIALPCATQFEINEESAKALIKNHCLGVFEGSNMSTTPEAVSLLLSHHVAYAPGKASNAGGVSVSGFEMLQNKAKEHWSKEKVDSLLKKTMEDIYASSIAYATSPKDKEDLVTLSNLNGFLRLVKAFKAKEGK